MADQQQQVNDQQDQGQAIQENEAQETQEQENKQPISQEMMDFISLKVNEVKEAKDNEIRGLNRKLSEVQNLNKELQKKSLSDKELFELEKKEFMEEKLSWQKRNIINDMFSDKPQEVRDVLLNSLNGETEETLRTNAENIQNILNAEKELTKNKTVDEVLAGATHKPKAGLNSGEPAKDYNKMTKEELTTEYKMVQGQPESPERTATLEKIAKIQLYNQTGRK